MLEKVEMTELEATANNVLPIDFGNATSAAAKDGSLKLYTTPELASIFNASTKDHSAMGKRGKAGLGRATVWGVQALG